VTARPARPRCRCSHARTNHSATTGRCWFGPCACLAFDDRPQPPELTYPERFTLARIEAELPAPESWKPEP
jgi:hypothetical protein